MIKKLHLAALLSPEFYQFMVLIAACIEKIDVTKFKLTAEATEFNELLKRLLAAFNRENAYQLSKILDQLDRRRDTAITGFTMWIKALTMHPNPTISTSAKALRVYLKTHGDNIANQNLQTETATLTKIISDFANNTELKNHLANLKDTEWMPEIETANNEYIKTYQQRTEQMGEDANKENFTQVRKLQIKAYENLVQMMVSRCNTLKADKENVTDLQNCIDAINATILQFKQLIAQTQTRKKEEGKN